MPADKQNRVAALMSTMTNITDVGQREKIKSSLIQMQRSFKTMTRVGAGGGWEKADIDDGDYGEHMISSGVYEVLNH